MGRAAMMGMAGTAVSAVEGGEGAEIAYRACTTSECTYIDQSLDDISCKLDGDMCVCHGCAPNEDTCMAITIGCPK